MFNKYRIAVLAGAGIGLEVVPVTVSAIKTAIKRAGAEVELIKNLPVGKTAMEKFGRVRPSYSLPGIQARCPGLDIVIVRENTEGFYFDRNMLGRSEELTPSVDMALAVGVFTRPAILRIAVAAFNFARTRRKHITIVHKKNATSMLLGWLRASRHDTSMITAESLMREAVSHVLSKGHLPADLGGQASTSSFDERVVAAIQSQNLSFSSNGLPA